MEKTSVHTWMLRERGRWWVGGGARRWLAATAVGPRTWVSSRWRHNRCLVWAWEGGKTLWGKAWGRRGTRVAGCFLTGLRGLLPGLEKYPKRTGEVSLEYRHCFKSFIPGYSSDMYRGCIEGVSVSDTVSDTDSLVGWSIHAFEAVGLPMTAIGRRVKGSCCQGTF